MRGAPGLILCVNLNRSPRTLEGCRAIAAAIQVFDPRVETRILHWTRVDADASRTLRARGVVIGPNEDPFPSYPPAFDRFLGWVRGRRGPTLGICGGHQALALAHGAPVGPVFRVPPATTSYAGMPKVTGTQRIRLLGDPDLLLEGIEAEIEVESSHVDEVKDTPPGFRVLAVGDPCHVQLIRADRRPLYGVQFHPERSAPGTGARRILENWVRLAVG
jgi:GMP synthase (glutamine-hydrolysing)